MDLRELEFEYEIFGELGRGGTSVVYHARERELGRDVAIKVVRNSHADDAEAAARLAREARLVALLRHPNIVPLLAVRRLSDGLALIMQHVPGRTLKRAIREQGPLPVALAERVLREIASALDYAHRRNIVHRDIKPENIYLDEEVGRALLADFGIARTTDSDSNLTLVGTALGTPAYMSPEQIDGTTLDGRSDFYSLGLVAHEMLSGQQPWAGNNLYSIIYKQKHEELPPLSAFRNDIPPYLQRAVEAMLRKDPKARCGSADELYAMLPPVAVPLRIESKPVAPPVAPRGGYDEDAPTIRYQRPTLQQQQEAMAAESARPAQAWPAPRPEPAQPQPAPAAPAPFAPATPTAPTMPAVAAVAAVVEETAGTPVVELPKVRPNWRRSVPRGRGALAKGTRFAPAEDAVPASPVLEAYSPDSAAQRKRRTRLVAAITVMLILGASATVVAMRGARWSFGAETPEFETGSPAADGLLKASAAPALLESATRLTEPEAKPDTMPPATTSSPAASSSTSSATTVTRQTQTSRETPRTETRDAPVSITPPVLSVPNISIPQERQEVSVADFKTPAPVIEDDVPETPAFTPHTVRPELRNREEVQRVLSSEYPAMLRERGVGGTVRLWVLVDSAGRVVRTELNQSSGNPMLDRAATRVAGAMRFSPAMNRNRKVSVWIQIPVVFRTE